MGLPGEFSGLKSEVLSHLHANQHYVLQLLRYTVTGMFTAAAFYVLTH